MKKYTAEEVKKILHQTIAASSKEELQIVLRIFGFSIKEFSCRADKDSVSVVFEIHYKREYFIEVSAYSNGPTATYSNEWINFGEGTDGCAVPTDNVGEMLLILLNLFVDKLLRGYEGPEYDERRDRDYSLEEVQILLEAVKEEMEAIQEKK